MILHCNYEELSALRSGGHSLLAGEADAPSYVLALSEHRAGVEALMSRLDGDLSFASLAELYAVEASVLAILDFLNVEMKVAVLATHAADEVAVAAYFDFAHVLTVSSRLRELSTEMEALIEVVTGEPAGAETALTFRFPD